jgi:hypothetical protein
MKLVKNATWWIAVVAGTLGCVDLVLSSVDYVLHVIVLAVGDAALARRLLDRFKCDGGLLPSIRPWIMKRLVEEKDVLSGRMKASRWSPLVLLFCLLTYQ